jgi:hypothetical protein
LPLHHLSAQHERAAVAVAAVVVALPATWHTPYGATAPPTCPAQQHQGPPKGKCVRRCHEPRSSAAVVLAPVLTYFTRRGSSANKQRLYCTQRGSPPVAAGPGCDDVQVTWAGDTHTQHLQHHQEFKKVGAVGGARGHPSHVVRGGCPSARHVTTTQAYNTDTHAAGVQTTTHTDTHPQGVTRAPRAALACSPLPPGATGLSLPAPLGNTSYHI